MKQVLVLFSSALAVFGAVAGSSAPAGGEGWAKRAYLDPAFVDFAYATNVVKAQVRLNGWGEFDRWNDARKRTGQPVRKCQMGMSSFVFRGRVKVPAAGRYRFRYTAVPPKDERVKNSAHFLAVNGCHVREFPEGFDLKAGEEVRLELFFRANGRFAQPITNGDVEWTTDGTWTKVEKVTWTAPEDGLLCEDRPGAERPPREGRAVPFPRLAFQPAAFQHVPLTPYFRRVAGRSSVSV